MFECGLGNFSFEWKDRESVHHDFEENWQRYKVNDFDQPTYRENISKAVSVYNSQHIKTSSLTKLTVFSLIIPLIKGGAN